MTGTVAYSVSGAMAIVTLDRPRKLNAFDSEMLLDIRQRLDQAARDDSVRVVVLTGTGRAFSSGQDLSAVLPPDGDADLGLTLERDYAPLVMRLIEFPKVTVAALNGPAVGAAFNIAMACDIVVAVQSAYLQQVFVRIGLIPDVGGTWLLPRTVGSKLGLALALTGDKITADEAKAMGLVYRVFPDLQFAEKTRAFAETLAGGPYTAHRLIKEAFRKSPENDIATQLKLEAELQRKAGKTADFREAVSAFASKRPPVFGGQA